MGFLHLLWTFIFIVQAANCALLTQPEQIHLAFGDNVSDISVTWTTFDTTPDTFVEYGIEGTDMKQLGSHKLFVDGGKEKRKIYIHRVLLTNLKPSTKYLYHCGSSVGISPQFWFRTVPAGDNWSPSVVIFGDMGNENAQSLEALQREGQMGMYDAAIHVGDFAYDMDSDDARIGDEFMNQIESFAGYLPYMVCPGNHEEAYNFSNYRNRFSMPMEGHDSMYYSFNLGPVHFISLSTEFYYFINYGIKQLVLQYDWLVEDLKEANKFENRQKQPWIVVFGHRPMYCSNLNEDDCTKYETLSRIGLPFTHAFGLEELLYKYGVDLQIWAHEHSYERLWPIYDYNVYNGSYEHPYTNPHAPVHIITGSAGCKEGREPFTITPPPWSAYHSQDYGYTRMKAMNGSHLYLEQVSDDKKGEVIDSFWIIKDSHGGYPERQHMGTKNQPKTPFETIEKYFFN